MLRSIIRQFSPPVFEDEEKTRVAQILNYLILITISLLSLLLLSRAITSSLSAATLITLGTLIVILTGSWFLLKKGFVREISIVIVIASWLALTRLTGGEGIRDTGLIAYFLVILIATMLLGRLAGALVTFASIASAWYYAILETRGLFIPTPPPANENALDITFIFIISTALLYLLDSGLRNTAKRAQENEKSLQESNQRLLALQAGLEHRVAERTAKLEETSIQAQKRTEQLEAIADVASSVAALKGIDQLLPYITQSISEQFGFYHTGIFLLSDDKKYAVLRAANSEGGQVMLARKHQLQVGQEGIVGFAAYQKQTRIALDVGEDAVYFDNPDLPKTRSEIALPLLAGDEIIGVLDVQSKEANAFSAEDVDVFTTLANQVAIAIQNARLFRQSQNALQELDATFRRYISNEWNRFTELTDIKGYRAVESGLEPIKESLQKDSSSEKTNNKHKVPIKLRNVTIGYLNINLEKPVEQYSMDELDIIQATVDRFALALENARLLETTSRRAAREHLVSDITTKIRSTNDPQKMIQTALAELKEALNVSKVELLPKEEKIKEG